MASDQELLSRYRAGDPRAMDELVDRHGASVYAFVRRFLGGGAAVDDVTQEVWLRVLRASDRYDGRARFTTWLFAVTRNACLDALRRQQRTQARRPAPDEAAEDEVSDLEASEPPVIDEVARRELSGLVEDAVAELPERLREVFLLREQTDMTFSEIAQDLELKDDTVKSRMRYALERIRRFVRQRLARRAPSDSEVGGR